jgi:hypothetical protein
MRFNPTSEAGLVCVYDASNSPPPIGSADLPTLIEDALARGFLAISGGDAVRLRVDAVVGNDPVMPNRAFQPMGGAFLVRLPSGRVCVSGLEEWRFGGAAAMSVTPGTYMARVLRPADFDSCAYREELVQLLGEPDVRYRERVSNFAFVGCVPSIAAAISLIVAPRLFLSALLPLAAAAWLPFVFLLSSRRFKAIEARIAKYEEGFPHYALRLDPAPADSLLTGGVLNLET